jgi:hypothetical protein
MSGPHLQNVRFGHLNRRTSYSWFITQLGVVLAQFWAGDSRLVGNILIQYQYEILKLIHP